MKKQNVYNALFWGVGWGMMEAVLGYALHLIPFRVSGFVMFPIGVFFMIKAFNETRNIAAVILVGLVAASIKMMDFLIPGVPVIKIVHPMMAIILESLAVAGVAYFSNNVLSLKNILLASLGWRTLYVLTLSIEALFSLTRDLAKLGTVGALQFIGYMGLINAIIIYLMSRLLSKSRLNFLAGNKSAWQVSLSLLLVICIEIFLR